MESVRLQVSPADGTWVAAALDASPVWEPAREGDGAGGCEGRAGTGRWRVAPARQKKASRREAFASERVRGRK